MGRGARRRWTTLVLLPASALAQTLTATNFVKYFDYDGPLATTGMVTVTTSGTTQTLEYSLTGVDNYCAVHVSGPDDNSCGIHIHSGTTCADDAGGHYYDDGTITNDPWAIVEYGGHGTTSGTAIGTASVETGLLSSELEGRTLIVHGYDGGRIACALLAGPPTPGPTPSPGNPTRRPTPKPTPRPTLRPTIRPTLRPTLRPTPQPTAITASMEEEDGSEDQGEDQGEDQDENKGGGGADAAGGGLAIMGIVIAAVVGLLCVGGFVRWKQLQSQDRTSKKGRETNNPIQRAASPTTAI